MRASRLLIVVSLCLSGVVALMNIQPTEAESLHTVTGADCTYDGLSQVVANAQAGDIIAFDCDSTSTTIVFTAHINIPADLTIDGFNGGNPMTFQGSLEDNEETRLLTAIGSDLTLLNLALRNGTSGSGGAIYTQDNNLRIYQCQFLYNSSPEQLGGAIKGSNSDVSIFKSSFTGNTAGTGGAIGIMGGSLEVSQTTFASNTSMGSSRNIAGGAIAAINGNATISQSRFEGNSTAAVGGAVFSTIGSLTISQTSFINNHALSVGAIAGETIDITGSTFSGNLASSGGSAIYFTAGEISRSTIIQPRNMDETPTSPALRITGSNTIKLTGVILGGFDDHCSFPSSVSLTVVDSLANDDSCVLDGTADWENVDVPLESLTDLTLYGVTQSFYPLDTSGTNPALNTASESCEFEDLLAPNAIDQIGTFRGVDGCDIGAIEFLSPANIPATITTFSTDPLPAYEYMAIHPQFTKDEPAVFTDFDCNIDDENGIAPGDRLTCFYPDQGIYFLYVYATDGHAVTSTIFPVHALNADPTINSFHASPQLLVPGESATLTYQAIDTEADTLTYNVDCGGGNLIDLTHCQFTASGDYTITLRVTDEDGGAAQRTQLISVSAPVNLCIDRWTGQTSMATSTDCGRGQIALQLPQANFLPLILCVNNWNGATRADLNDRGCSRSEHTVFVDGMRTVSVCVNNWNNTIRVSDRCNRSEHTELL